MKISASSKVGSLGIICSFALLCFLSISTSEVSAQEEDTSGSATGAKEAEVVENVKTGVIAGSGSYGMSGSFDVITGGAAPGDETNVITGSVNHLQGGRCEAKVNNTSEVNSYSVRFRVVGARQIGDSRKTLKSYAASLKPGASSSKEFNCDGYQSLGVDLRSARKIGN